MQVGGDGGISDEKRKRQGVEGEKTRERNRERK